MNEYEAQAERFLAFYGYKLTIRDGDGRCPRWGHEKGCQHGNHYRVTIRHTEGGKSWPLRSMTFDWWGSLDMARRGEAPTNYNILASLSAEATSPTDPDEVAEEFGPIPPTQAVAVAKFAQRLQRFFGIDLDALAEIQ